MPKIVTKQPKRLNNTRADRRTCRVRASPFSNCVMPEPGSAAHVPAQHDPFINVSPRAIFRVLPDTLKGGLGRAGPDGQLCSHGEGQVEAWI